GGCSGDTREVDDLWREKQSTSASTNRARDGGIESQQKYFVCALTATATRLLTPASSAHTACVPETRDPPAWSPASPLSQKKVSLFFLSGTAAAAAAAVCRSPQQQQRRRHVAVFLRDCAAAEATIG
ncbi:unnamed protein product, partial [Ectocarpus sp. 12 AP-2014]